jgi:5-methylcytosine-specific restriction endonuclease McrA
MTSADPDSIRLRLDPASYEKLRQRVLRRDRWRCQCCGTMSNLEVHHKQFRSRSGDDSEGNLITLCAYCHEEMHIPRRRRASIATSRRSS